MTILSVEYTHHNHERRNDDDSKQPTDDFSTDLHDGLEQVPEWAGFYSLLAEVLPRYVEVDDASQSRRFHPVEEPLDLTRLGGDVKTRHVDYWK